MLGWSLDMQYVTSGCRLAWFQLWFHTAVLFYFYILCSHLLLLERTNRTFSGWSSVHVCLFKEMMENSGHSSPFWISNGTYRCVLNIVFCHTSIEHEMWTVYYIFKSEQAIVWLCFFSFFRATLYVGKYSTSLYASPSLVHDGVTVVVSDSYMYIFI